MRTIAAMYVDLDESPLGTRSRLRNALAGVPILRRTVDRALRIRGIDGVHLLVSPMQADEVRSIVGDLAVQIETHDAPAPPYRGLVRASRAWGLDGWRGGVSSLCVFDEDFNAALLQGLCAKTHAQAVLSLPAAAPLLDPDLISSMIEHFRANLEMSRMTFMQAPPGLNAIVLARDVIDQLLPVGMPPGAMLVYQPNSPAPDLTGREACYRSNAAIVRAHGRLLCDTTRSMDRVQRIFDAGGESWNAVTLCHWLAESDRGHIYEHPAEIEVELTTEDQLDERCLLQPRGAGVTQRHAIRASVIDRIVESMTGSDDMHIVLGGFGEPTLHPEFPAICARLRAAGAGAICVRTNGIAVPLAAEKAMFENPIDAIEVTLNAANSETYRNVHGLDGFDKVMATIDRWSMLRTERQSVRPLIVPSMIKAFDTLDDLEPFVDHWQRRLGTYAVHGASHYAGQRPNRAVTMMTPSRRDACRRVFDRMMVLADGSVTTCDQDFAARQVFGNLNDSPLRELWKNPRLTAVRNHRIDDCPLCPHCDEWHRP